MARKHGFSHAMGVAGADDAFYSANEQAKEKLVERLGREGSPMRLHAAREKIDAGGRRSFIDGGLTAQDEYAQYDQHREHWE